MEPSQTKVNWSRDCGDCEMSHHTTCRCAHQSHPAIQSILGCQDAMRWLPSQFFCWHREPRLSFGCWWTMTTTTTMMPGGKETMSLALARDDVVLFLMCCGWLVSLLLPAGEASTISILANPSMFAGIVDSRSWMHVP
jgi:hypothetical protein